MALKVATQILNARHDFEVMVEAVPITVHVEGTTAIAWPAIENLDELENGPWPPEVHLRCTWSGGAVSLVCRLSFWNSKDAYRHLVGLSIVVAKPRRELVWITVPLWLFDGTASEPVIPVSFAPVRKRNQPVDPDYMIQRASRAVVARAGLPFATDYNVEAFRVRTVDCAVLPSPSVAFERLCHVALCKLPFFVGDARGVDGSLPFSASDVAPSESVFEPEQGSISGKRAGIWPLPGGVRQYKATLDLLLESISDRQVSVPEFFALMLARLDVKGETARTGYLNVLLATGLCASTNDVLNLTAEGRQYLETRSSAQLFEILHRTYLGILELLTLVDERETLDGNSAQETMRALLSVNWSTRNQVNFRRNWLLSLGLTDRTSDGDSATHDGRAVLGQHAAEVDAIRERIRSLADAVASQESVATVQVDDEVADVIGPGLDGARTTVNDEPSAWAADRVLLRAESVAAHCAALELPIHVAARAVAALSSGKHLLLVGPPGTGKTELAHAIAAAAMDEGYCAGAYVTTASADWTTFDTIGGYALRKSGELAFREGALLRAISRREWLVIDELNRADVDRAFGEMMTVLAGRTTDTSFELESGNTVRIGPDPTASHPMPKTYRVLATMNTWDKTSLFRLSYAIQRRFAIIHVGVPHAAGYEKLVRRSATQLGFDSPLSGASVEALVELFSNAGVLSTRSVGPAIAIDVIRYARRRVADPGVSEGEAIAEAIAMFVLPQLEGLEPELARRALTSILQGVRGPGAEGARSELRDRFMDLFPHVTLSSE